MQIHRRPSFFPTFAIFIQVPETLTVMISYLNLLASRSDSRRQRISSSRTNLIFFSLGSLFAMVSEVLLTWALDVTNNTSSRVVHEFHSHLGDASTRTYKVKSSVRTCVLNCGFEKWSRAYQYGQVLVSL